MTSTFTLSIQLDNVAFDDEPMTEVARILRTLANKVEQEGPDPLLLHYNGNRVGKAGVS